MIETTIYKCEICGAEFDNEYEANCHEFVCRYNEVEKLDGSCLKFYKANGAEIKFDNSNFIWAEFDDVAAFAVGNDNDVRFVEELFAWKCNDNPFRFMADAKISNYYGLWWYDPNLHYDEWVRVDDQIKK